MARTWISLFPKRIALVGTLAGIASLAFTGGWVFAQGPMPPVGAEPAADGPAMHERMREAIGQDTEAMMEQCAMMRMMTMMQGMGGMMGQGAMPGMMSPPDDTATDEMMRRMMGR